MDKPWMDEAKSVDERVATLLAAMTLEECVAQLVQVTFNSLTEAELTGGIGSVMLCNSATAGNDAQEASLAEDRNKQQHVAVEQSRLGIPIIFARDVIHGHKTVFPIPLGQGAGWDPELVHEVYRASAIEASADGIRWVFSPMLDICRDPRWGRIAEGFGESAYLTGVLGVAAVKGIQGDDLTAATNLVACAKHYAGYGAAEGGRDYNTTEITWPTMNDVYLRPFEAVVRAGCQTVMTSFNCNGGLPTCANRKLLVEILRETWGFEGLVVTDWHATAELVPHGLAANEAEASALAIEAGSDMDMEDRCFARVLAGLVRTGRLGEAVVRRAAARVLRMKFMAGLFDRPYTELRKVDRTPHRAISRHAAARCAVLLTNNGTLPLAKPGCVAVVGPMANATWELFGTWTLDGVRSEPLSLADALKEALGDGCRMLNPAWHDASMVQHHARRADVTVLVLGECPSATGEANAVADLGLPPGQGEMLERLVSLGTPVVLVVIAGRPLVLPEAADRCAAILWSFHPGTEGARGLADVICGKAEPGGRLPVTFPRHLGQVPIYHDQKPTGRPLHEYERKQGAKGFYRYLDCQGQPRFPFGFGLGYTSFELGEARVVGTATLAGGISVEVPVRNVGERTGSTVVQMYLGDPVAELSQPVRRLVAFRRVELAAGAQSTIQLDVAPESLEYTHLDGKRRSDPGEFVLMVGQSSTDVQSIRVTVSG